MRRASSLALFLVVGLCGAAPAWSQANPDSVTLCHENEDAFPWLIKAKPGYSQIMVQHLEKQLGLPVKLSAMPWKQCLDSVKAGSVDGAINASFTKDRAEFALYPLKLDGEPDATKRMYRASYALYKAKGAAVQWDGQKLEARGTFGAQRGFSIVGQLKTLGATTEDTAPTADELLERVAAGRYIAAAVQTTEAENSLASIAGLAGKIERVQPVLAEKPYYTIFSKGFAAKHANTTREIWRLEGKIRESAEFKTAVSHLMKSVD